MTDSEDDRCPNCDSPDLVVVHTTAIADELIECRVCLKLYRLEYRTWGTPRLVPV